MDKPLTIIGRAEKIDLLDFGVTQVPAKVDTGADSSSLWASNIVESESGLQFTLFGEGSSLYNGQPIVKKKWQYTLTRVANSFGQKELRYKVKLRIRVNGRIVRATFTLADRSHKTYPILLGRRLLQGKFLVDVADGEPLRQVERNKAKRLKNDITKLRDKE